MARATFLAVLALILLRLVVAALTPLAFDEAYYWTWSKHIAGGYYDHPPMVAIIIRLSTSIAGETELGIRLVSILLALPMSWALYRTATILFASERVAATATILLNISLVGNIGTTIVTPDSPLLVASCFFLFSLAKVMETGRGAWWIAVGLSVGCALLSKYTAFFFIPAAAIWLAVVPRMRLWFRSPWPYLGLAVAFAIFSPTIAWNANHQWVSFQKNFGRAYLDRLSTGYLVEVIPAQFLLATPLFFILGVMGIILLFRRTVGTLAASTLINVIFWPITIYFIWHSLHQRVEANWFGPVYPAFAIAAGVAVHLVRWSSRTQRVVDLCHRWAAPTGIVIFVMLSIQVNTGAFFTVRDPLLRNIGVGWRETAREIEALRIGAGANCILAGNYITTSWLAYYLPAGSCVVQRNERIRWVNGIEPPPTMLRDPLLFVGQPRPDEAMLLSETFGRVNRIAEVKRVRGALVIETIDLTLLDGAKRDVFDRAGPPELGWSR